MKYCMNCKMDVDESQMECPVCEASIYAKGFAPSGMVDEPEPVVKASPKKTPKKEK